MNVYVSREHTRMCMPRLLQNYDCYFARKNDKKTMFLKKEFKFKSKIPKIPLNTDKILWKSLIFKDKKFFENFRVFSGKKILRLR